MDDYTTNPTSEQPEPVSESTLRAVYEVIAMLGDADPHSGSEWTPDAVMRWGVNCLGALLLQRDDDVSIHWIMSYALMLAEINLPFMTPFDDEDGDMSDYGEVNW